ncbi:hypothetical protein AJ79_04797 [Helicocarpus griseus UAMH5409]|uniref:Uncharacterized protein n=1 Tax=Helicocarpus griseus UAMH5409 TaxID=1447875 RepID=A0A2B7XRD8_9EURO|nr:hypothetical protein AJ79_04797 [Helicocarpus griseus UAMH5409]
MNPSQSPSAEARTAQQTWSDDPSQKAHSSSTTAPTYVNPIVGNPSSQKPKGTNLTEGGFSNVNPADNASFNSEIGSENDPSLLAEMKMQGGNARNPGERAAPVDQPGNIPRGTEGHASERKGGQPYGVLGSEESA